MEKSAEITFPLPKPGDIFVTVNTKRKIRVIGFDAGKVIYRMLDTGSLCDSYVETFYKNKKKA